MTNLEKTLTAAICLSLRVLPPPYACAGRCTAQDRWKQQAAAPILDADLEKVVVEAEGKVA